VPSMKVALNLLVPILVSVLLSLSACSSFQFGSKKDAPLAAHLDTTAIYTNAIYVLVDGQDRGQVPMTLRLRRGFGTRLVSLWQRGKEIRKYELETVHTAAGTALQQGFWSTQTNGVTTYDVRNLPSKNENYFYIPYSMSRLLIEDHTFGLTMIVEE
jgi:hypothetical protein